jgi:serine/arginine repetitive matrix protein 2
MEHSNFEFSLSLDIRRDPHILKILHEQANPAAGPSRTSAPASINKTSGFRSLFSSPRKVKPGRPDPPSRSSTPLPTPPPVVAETIAKYFATPTSSTIAKTHVAFKPIAKNCEAKVLEIRYPMFAMFKGEPDRTPGGAGAGPQGSGPRKQVAKITLQIFRLPPIAGLTADDLPASIDDCLRGIRHHAWHENEYHEGVLTQEGGDCTVSVAC